MESPLIANGAEISRIGGLVEIAKIERKYRRLGKISILLQDRLK
jgi:hypothetical protein